jgi:hypothetical protein
VTVPKRRGECAFDPFSRVMQLWLENPNFSGFSVLPYDPTLPIGLGLE